MFAARLHRSTGVERPLIEKRHLRSLLRSRSYESLLVWAIATTGLLLPWCVGIGVKLYLDARGEPTWDWLYFLHPGTLIAEVWATLWFAAPSLLLALVSGLLFCGRFEPLRRLNRLEMSLLVLPAALWGGYASVTAYIEMFWSFHPVAFLLPFFYTALYVGQYVLGLLAGIVLASIAHAARRMTSG